MRERWTKRARDIESFKVMDLLKRAGELAASGADVVHLGAGEPDFGAAPSVIARAKELLDTQPLTYTSAGGIQPLREAIASFHQQRYGHAISADQVLVTAGASAGLMLAFALIAEQGTHFLMADPAYPCNRQFLRLVEAGAKLIPVDHHQNYQLNADLVQANWDDETSGVLIASPANPTGAVLDANELMRIAEVVKAQGGTLIVDEIYHGLTYGAQTPSAIQIDPNAIVINSFSKYFGMTGWRLGWLVSSKEAIAEMEKMAQNLFISPPTLSQYAALSAFQDDALALFEERRLELQARRDLLLVGLLELGFEVPRVPEGAFYIYADASALTDDSFAWCWDLLEQAKVVATPGADFGSNHAERYVRFAYTTSQDQIREALRRIRRFIENQSA